MSRPFKLPRTTHGAADVLYHTRQRRLRPQEEIDELKGQEEMLKEFLLSTLHLGTIVKGNDAVVEIVPHDTFEALDWPDVYNFILRYQAFDILKRALVPSALEAWWGTGIEVSGIVRRSGNAVAVRKR